MTPEYAEKIAVSALAWLAQDDDLMPVFLGATGSSADDLRAQASDPAFLVSVLDFILMDDKWVIGFCDSENISYEIPMHARHALPGGADMHWT
ncbi:hypothetical protein AIOL_000351 [Candidatus Rhodobacter oscarellae]|uniref:DUF3572 domain-containing protein n=1 Tax=Candidatus Rhodobacter oscarellae TaxID=1675527 RepID=A0A0J9H3H5_9RHOB|nr:DUF3572 domain-containing protein [Candidatus Rhodobacter lobularis]KMW60198.1 hypothetical protein AIOL_000351 [Candidatus Rhodobacter lobularis]